MAELPHDAFQRLIAMIKCDDALSVPVGGGRTALIDSSDAGLILPHKWTSTDRYAITCIDGRRVMMHRLILSAPKHMIVDHEDGDGFNNQRYNLRLCSHEENMRNRVSISGQSRFKGVHPTKHSWRAQIGYKGKKIRLGMFSSEVKAARAYDAAALKYHGRFAKTNADLGLY